MFGAAPPASAGEVNRPAPATASAFQGSCGGPLYNPNFPPHWTAHFDCWANGPAWVVIQFNCTGYQNYQTFSLSYHEWLSVACWDAQPINNAVAYISPQ